MAANGDVICIGGYPQYVYNAQKEKQTKAQYKFFQDYGPVAGVSGQEYLTIEYDQLELVTSAGQSGAPVQTIDNRTIAIHCGLLKRKGLNSASALSDGVFKDLIIPGMYLILEEHGKKPRSNDPDYEQ